MMDATLHSQYLLSLLGKLCSLMAVVKSDWIPSKWYLIKWYSPFCLQCSDALQSSPLTEAAELLDLLNHIEFEGLLFAHDKLAERQVPRIGIFF